jgi:2-C-methyl-D-erythritol 4-phosphate cytidylyltransferase
MRLQDSCGAVIVAAGRGKRMGFDKVFAPLGGIPLFLHAVRAFLGCSFVREIVVVAAPQSTERMQRDLAEAGCVAPHVRVTSGGVERMDSVLRGLEALKFQNGYVAVHDAARPLITTDVIELCYRAACRTGAAACAEPLADSIHRAGPERIVTGALDREGVWRMQTPQIFRFRELVAALSAAKAAGRIVTDEVSAAVEAGIPVELVEPSDLNFKVTRPADFDLAKLVYEARQKAVSMGG